MMCRWLLIVVAMTACFVGVHTGLSAAEQVTVVVGSDAPALDRLAAEELAGQFRRLFDAEVTISSGPPPKTGAIVLLGHPDTNPELKRALGENLAPEDEQQFAVRGFRKGPQSGLIVVGGSPAATLWAVYELGHHFGIRYLLRDDIYPEAPIPLELSQVKITQSPELRTRAWRTIDDGAIGPESWSLAEHKRVLGQLAKLKFNRIMLSVHPWQPFVHYECQGVAKRTGVLGQGQQYPIPRDMPGRTALGEATQFENPDFTGKTTYDEMLAAGTRQAGGIMDEAHRLGMSVGVSISPLEFPREFAEVLPGAQPVPGRNNLLLTPGAQQAWNDPRLKELVAAKIRAYLTTYPQIDVLYLRLPESPQWDHDFEAAGDSLFSSADNNKPQWSEMLQAASRRTLLANGQRGERSLKASLVALAFLKDLLRDENLLRHSDGRRVELVISQIDPELYPWLEKILPAGAGTLNLIDETARRTAEHEAYLARVPADKVRSSLTMTLADDKVGILSQSATRRLETLLGQLRKNKWDGFVTRYWMLAELDPAVVYLARAAWDAKLTPRQAHDDLMTTISGKQSVADRLWLGLGHIEQAAELIDKNDLGFGFPAPGLLMKHAQPQPAPEWWGAMKEQYTQAMVEMYRSHDGTDPRARRLLFYWAKRSEFVLEYLACVEAVREATILRKYGDPDKAAEKYEAAIEQLYNAMDTLSDVARDSGDRGLIAVLNAHAYQPLLEAYEKLADE